MFSKATLSIWGANLRIYSSFNPFLMSFMVVTGNFFIRSSIDSMVSFPSSAFVKSRASTFPLIIFWMFYSNLEGISFNFGSFYANGFLLPKFKSLFSFYPLFLLEFVKKFSFVELLTLFNLLTGDFFESWICPLLVTFVKALFVIESGLKKISST